MRKHIILYSHGFGVRKDDRGLFTDVAHSIPNAQHIMFDYNEIDDAKNTLTVSPLKDQVKRLKSQLESIESGTIVDIIAHSQGCIVTALAKPQNVRRILFLAPPDNVDVDRLIGFFGNREGSTINLEGNSLIPRRDGSTTIIPVAYWQSLRGLDVIRLYNRLPDLAEVTFYVAHDDEVLGVSNFDKADERINLLPLAGNHDFTGTARSKLTAIIRNAVV